jgi:hypothetical protein
LGATVKPLDPKLPNADYPRKPETRPTINRPKTALNFFSIFLTNKAVELQIISTFALENLT